MNLDADATCNFNGRIETEGLLTVSHVHCKSGNISETVQDRELLLQTTNRKCYRIAQFPMTFEDINPLQTY